MRTLLIALLSLAIVGLCGPWSIARADKSNFALFDGTNPANTDPGAICGANKPENIKANKAFTLHVGVSNFSGSTKEFKVIYTDGDFVRYQVPAGTSFNLSQAAGGPGGFDAAVRVDSDDGMTGSVSAIGSKVFCFSCDEPPGAGDANCDLIIPN